jgi:uncharacterized membrane protein
MSPSLGLTDRGTGIPYRTAAPSKRTEAKVRRRSASRSCCCAAPVGRSASQGWRNGLPRRDPRAFSCKRLQPSPTHKPLADHHPAGRQPGSAKLANSLRHIRPNADWLPYVRTERGLHRLVTFLDAVVAIAITLLVLPLIDLLGSGGSHRHDLGSLLGDNLDQLGSFLLTFVVIASAWLSHHRLLERVGTYDEAFLLINLAWVLTVVVLPFSTQVIADFNTQRLSVGIYIGTIALNSACATALTLLVQRRPALRRENDNAGTSGTLASLVRTGLVFFALVLGVALPAVNFFALLLLLLTGPFVGLIRTFIPRAER